MVVRRLPFVTLLAVATVGAAACGDNEATAFCTTYDGYVGVVDPILAADASTVSPPEVRDALDGLVDELEQLRAASDGRFWATIDDLLERVEDVGRALATAPDDADYDTWAPLVADSLDDAIDSDVRLREVVDPVCSPADVS